MEKINVVTDEIYEYAADWEHERKYIIKFMDSGNQIVMRKICAPDFRHAYDNAAHIAYQEKFNRIVSIEEVMR